MRSTSESIGKLTKIKSDVRRLNTKTIFWTDAKKNDTISRGDSIFVGADSNTLINFYDGTFITVGANSLVKFYTQEKVVKLALEYGSIQSSNLPKNFILDDCGKTLNIETTTNTDLVINKSNCDRVQIQSNTGSIKINNKAIKSQIPINLKSSIWPAPPKFKEKPAANETMVEIEKMNLAETTKIASLSFDELMKKFATSEKIAPSQPALVQEINPAPVIQKPAPVPVVIKRPPPLAAIIKPPLIADDSTNLIFFFQKTPSKHILLKWMPTVKLSPTYQVEVAKKSDFSKIFKTYSTVETSLAIEDVLPVGKYYWRVRSQSKSSISSWSKFGLIEIIPSHL